MTSSSAETAYLFRHALVRDAAYQLQLPAERATLHESAAAALKLVLGDQLAVRAGVETLAHLRLAAEFLQEQGTSRTQTGKLDSAALARVEAALQAEFNLLEPVAVALAQRRDLLALVSIRHRQSTHPCQPEQSRPLAELAYAVALRMTGRVSEAEAIHRRVLQSVHGHQDSPVRGRALAGLATICQYTGRTTEAEELELDAIAVARRLGDSEFLAVLLGNYGSLLKETGRAVEAIQVTHEAIERTRQNRQPMFECRFLANLAAVLSDTGRNAEAVETAAKTIQLAQDLNAIELEGVCRGNMASALAGLGRDVQADAEYERAQQLALTAGDLRVAAIWSSVIGLRAIRAGNLARAEQVLHAGESAGLEASTPTAAARCRVMLELLAIHRGKASDELLPLVRLLHQAKDHQALSDATEAAKALGIVLPFVDANGSADKA